MKIALVQMAAILDQPAANCAVIERLAAELMPAKPDVIVLPEMWNIGFFPNEPWRNADNNGRLAKTLLSKLARQYSVNIIGGTVASKESDALVNINYNFDRNGKLLSEYRKMHLFSPSGEDRQFTAGNKLSTFYLDGVKAAVATCYDIRFCELIRLLALENIAILFVPAAWAKPRLMHWQTLLRTRAIENQIFVVGLNAVGTANALEFCGGSMIIDPWGEVIAEGGGAESLISAAIDINVIRDIRRRINVFKDRRSDLYSLAVKN